MLEVFSGISMALIGVGEEISQILSQYSPRFILVGCHVDSIETVAIK